ncbi:MAG: MFS transporter [Candidatus Hodarchaeota archaeon]
MFLDGFIHIQKLPKQAQWLIRKYLLIYLLNSLVLNLASTFYILFVISKIEFAKAGVIISIMLLVQLVSDYPSGSLGDWIGQRWVLATAYFLYGSAYFILFFAESFADFVIISLIFGLGNAQASGTITSWRDNNYQKLVSKDLDPERKNYGFTLTRVDSLNMITLALTFIIGGFMATLISREFVFLLQSVLCIFTVLIILIILQDVKTDYVIKDKKKVINGEYFHYLKGGIEFLISNRTVFLFIIGISIYTVTWTIWGSLILFPLYFGYSGSDSIAGILRTIIYVNGVAARIYIVSYLGRRFSIDKIPHLLLLHLLFFFPGFIILLYFVPVNNSFNLLGFVLIIIFQNILISIILGIEGVLRQRFMLDLIPAENRNAVYSLIPTLIALFSIPIMPVAGWLIDAYGLSAGLMLAFGTALLGTIFIGLALYLRNKTLKSSLKSVITTDREGIAVVT